MKNLKSLNQKNTHSIRQGAMSLTVVITLIAAQVRAFAQFGKINLKMENFMKKIFLVLIVMSSSNCAIAHENTPVNFQRDQRLGQFNMSSKMIINGEVSQFEDKICFVTDRLQNDLANEKFEAGCSAKKSKDSATELEYLVTCNGKPEIHMHWVRTSTNEYTFLSKSSESEFTSTYRYVGTKCDADAIRK